MPSITRALMPRVKDATIRVCGAAGRMRRGRVAALTHSGITTKRWFDRAMMGAQIARSAKIRGRFRRSTGAPVAALKRLSLALLVPAALVSCATPGQRSGDAFPAGEVGRVFAVGYQSITERYVDPVDIGTVAFEGLSGLSTLDSGISVARNGDLVELRGPDGILAKLDAPDDADAAGWAKLTAIALDAGRAGSPHLEYASTERLYQVVFEGALSRLDGFSRYTGAEEALEQRAAREGFGGIGIRFALAGDGVQVTAVLPDSPAARADIQTDDLITHVDGSPVAGLDHRAVARRLRGRVDSRVELTLARTGLEGSLKLTLARKLIIPTTVEARLEGDLAYFRVIGFNQRTTTQVSDALSQLKQEAEIAGVVLDLRDNPGGLLDQAVAVADLFLSRGRILSTIGRHPDSNQEFDATDDDIADGLPMAVLINGQSASAAEIVAAALQDHGRALVIGSTSFGKGTVQNVIRLPNNGELILTWSRMLTPSGQALHELGVAPTICTSNPQTSAPGAVDDLLRGAAEPGSTLALSRGDQGRDRETSEELRRVCPSRHSMPEADLEVTRKLLGDAELYARALQLSFPAVATR